MENRYLISKEKKECNGCGICTLGCPVNAIKMVEDKEGFYYPQIDEKKCIKCNKCKNICSNFNDSKDFGKAYMAINKNDLDKKRSASGGIFFALAKYVIEEKKGVVFGVEYGDNLKVQHNHYETLEECKRFQGSKYVRSNIRNSYNEVKEYLENGRWVLFSGTPCQCNALKTYLKKVYDKLILCEIICHANPSQKVFDMYIKELEKKYNKKIVDFKFRDKKTGWHNQYPIVTLETGEEEEEALFFRAFVSELLDRPSCNSCKFAGLNRVSDITIGDFWGIDKVLPDIKDDDTGISLFVVNSKKGENVFEKISKKLEYKKIDKKLAFSYNHNRNVPVHAKRKQFFNNLSKMPVMENMEKCLKVNIIKKFERKLKRMVKRVIKGYNKYGRK